jgi:hypothetical protein
MKPAIMIPAISDQDAKTLRELYDDVKRGMQRVLGLGMFCIELKHRLPHGQFQDALSQAVPEISYRTVANSMELVRGIFAIKSLDLDGYLSKVQPFHFSHGGEIFLLPEPEIPEPLRPIRRAADDVVEGKSQRELRLQIKSLNGKGGFHPPTDDLIAWLQEHHKEVLTDHKTPYPLKQHITFEWLKQNYPEVAAAFKKQWKPKPLSAELALQARRDRFDRMLNTVAASLDEKEFSHAITDRRRAALDLFRDYYKALSASLKGNKNKGKGK